MICLAVSVDLLQSLHSRPLFWLQECEDVFWNTMSNIRAVACLTLLNFTSQMVMWALGSVNSFFAFRVSTPSLAMLLPIPKLCWSGDWRLLCLCPQYGSEWPVRTSFGQLICALVAINALELGLVKRVERRFFGVPAFIGATGPRPPGRGKRQPGSMPPVNYTTSA